MIGEIETNWRKERVEVKARRGEGIEMIGGIKRERT